MCAAYAAVLSCLKWFCIFIKLKFILFLVCFESLIANHGRGNYDSAKVCSGSYFQTQKYLGEWQESANFVLDSLLATLFFFVYLIESNGVRLGRTYSPIIMTCALCEPIVRKRKQLITKELNRASSIMVGTHLRPKPVQA